MSIEEPSYLDEYRKLFGEPVDCRVEMEPPPRLYPEGQCERCGSTEGVKWEDSRTAYDTTRFDRFDHILHMDDPDPNAPQELCRDCAEQHHDWWDEQWNDYYSSRL